ncbi:hypothetical protein PM082_015203 [Marasmius tenuissimus]|nr:hypothetical protein PM082_015203 [Marasmius tenuissimus]
MPPLARRAEEADSSPNVALIVGLTVGGILLILCVVSAILFIRRRRQRRPQPVRSVSAHRFNIDIEKPDSEALQPLHNPFETDADHRYRRQSYPGIGHPKVYLSYEESPTLPDFDTTALLQEQQPNPHSSPFPSPLSSTFGRQDEHETRPISFSVSPKSLPRLTIPNSPKHQVDVTTTTTTIITTSQHDSDSAVEATLYAPGTSDNVAISPIQSQQSASASPPTPRLTLAPPPKFSRESIPVHTDSDSDTDSAYSQGSASTRLHGDFSTHRNEIPPPVPALPDYLRRPTVTMPMTESTTQAQGEEEEELDENGNPLQRVPTILIAGLLKKRARRSGSGGPPTRQLSRVSRIERSDSITSYRGNDSTSALAVHRRSTKRRRKNDSVTTGEPADLAVEVEGLKTVWERESESSSANANRESEPSSAVTVLPNPFGAALSPTVSPSTTRPPTPGSEHVVLCYQPEVSKSDSVTSESVQPLRMSKRGVR